MLHLKGTRYENLHMDPLDGLITGGATSVQLTFWMPKSEISVVTPRQGKAVEICALWYNFLKTLEELSGIANGDPERYADLAKKVKSGFSKFWNPADACLFDVIADDGSADASIRPNQLFAVSLPFQLLTSEKERSVLDVVEKHLLTPFGLRTLSLSRPILSGTLWWQP